MDILCLSVNIRMPCWWVYTWQWGCWPLTVCVCVFSFNSISQYPSYTPSSHQFPLPPAVWVASSCSIASFFFSFFFFHSFTLNTGSVLPVLLFPMELFWWLQNGISLWFSFSLCLLFVSLSFMKGLLKAFTCLFFVFCLFFNWILCPDL